MITTLDDKFWRSYFMVYDTLNLLIPYHELLKSVASELPIVSGDRVLDAGSGTGNLSLVLEERGAIVTALDYSSVGQEIHRSKRRRNDTNFVNASLTSALPFSGDTFAHIASNNVIYTLPPKSRAFLFKEFFRIIKPGGIIAISNITTGFSPRAIYLEHLKRSSEERGVFATLTTTFRLFIPTVKIFYYNWLIRRASASGAYRFLTSHDQRELMESAGFRVRKECGVYAKQGVLTVGQKPL